MAITTTHRLLTDFWAANVSAVETAIMRFHTGKRPANDCQIAFFEIAGDEHLHVNVTHQKPTTTVDGWAGPASVTGGFVHNRRFSEEQSGQLIRHIRHMAFAPESSRSS